MDEFVKVFCRVVKMHWYTWKAKYILDSILDVCRWIIYIGFLPKTLINWTVGCHLANSKRLRKVIIESDFTDIIKFVDRADRAYRNLYIED
jgi:hypothetical protein